MLDLKLLRDDPEAVDHGWARRGLPPHAAELLALDAQRRAALTELQELQAQRNEWSRQIGEVKRQGGSADGLQTQVATAKERMAALELQEQSLAKLLDARLASLPNLPDADVPDGMDESGNVAVRRYGDPPNRPAAPHDALGLALAQMDFERAAKLAGARFTILSGPLALLERALGNFMLDLHTRDFGYVEVSPPLLVRDEVMFGTAQLPKFIDDQFQTTDGRWLVPTAEVPLTNMVAGEILSSTDLPLRWTARTPCFRREAGSAGRDTRGMIRQHQFYKVELVSITTPEQGAAELERMTEAAETVLRRLGLPFRTMLLCAGDMGFAARKTYDLEVWLPGQQTFREISSCSHCGDFQARRMNTRCRAAGDKTTRFVHTLNGSGLAVGRALVAVMENYQQEDGSIAIPDVLVPYLNGLRRISR